jgi:hypothetical protein
MNNEDVPDERELQDEYEPEPYTNGVLESFEEDNYVNETPSTS